MSVLLKLDGGIQPTPNGNIDTGTDNILSRQALFGLLNATKQGRQYAHEFRAGKEAWGAVYDLFEETTTPTPGVSTRVKPNPDQYELLFAGIPVLYDATLPSDSIQAWGIGVMFDKQLGQLTGVTR